MVISDLKGHKSRTMSSIFRPSSVYFLQLSRPTNPKETLRQIVSGAARSMVLQKAKHIKCAYHVNM